MARGTFQLMRWALEVEGLTQPQAFVLYLLAVHADGKRLTYVGQETLARETRSAVKTVQRALKELERRGVIAREPRYKEGKRTSDWILVKPDDQKPDDSDRATGLSGQDLPDSHDPFEALRDRGTTPVTTRGELPDNTSLADASDGEHGLERFQELLNEWPGDLDEAEIAQARKAFEKHLRYRVDPQTMIDGVRPFADSGEVGHGLRWWIATRQWKDN